MSMACVQQGGCSLELHDGGSEVGFHLRVLLGHGSHGWPRRPVVGMAFHLQRILASHGQISDLAKKKCEGGTEF